MALLSDFHKGEGHWVEDVLPEGLTLVFCGTALSRVSAEKRAYYANHGNQFWKAIHRIGLTPHPIAPEDYATLPLYGIGLTDLCKSEYGQDAELSARAFDREAFEQKIVTAQPKVVAFTSKRAASEYLQKPVNNIQYGKQQETIDNTMLYTLCSPSGLARKWWNEEVWEGLKELVLSKR